MHGSSAEYAVAILPQDPNLSTNWKASTGGSAVNWLLRSVSLHHALDDQCRHSRLFVSQMQGASTKLPAKMERGVQCDIETIVACDGEWLPHRVPARGRRGAARVAVSTIADAALRASPVSGSSRRSSARSCSLDGLPPQHSGIQQARSSQCSGRWIHCDRKSN